MKIRRRVTKNNRPAIRICIFWINVIVPVVYLECFSENRSTNSVPDLCDIALFMSFLFPGVEYFGGTLVRYSWTSVILGTSANDRRLNCSAFKRNHWRVQFDNGIKLRWNNWRFRQSKNSSKYLMCSSGIYLFYLLSEYVNSQITNSINQSYYSRTPTSPTKS